MRVKIAHTEPVNTWGFVPCGEGISPTTVRGSGRGGHAPRPSGLGRGNSEVNTSLNRSPQVNGRWNFSSGLGKGENYEQVPPPVAASLPCFVLDDCLQNSYRGRTGSKSCYETIVAKQVAATSELAANDR